MELHCSKCIMHPVWCIMLHGGSGRASASPIYVAINVGKAGPRTPAHATKILYRARSSTD